MHKLFKITAVSLFVIIILTFAVGAFLYQRALCSNTGSSVSLSGFPPVQIGDSVRICDNNFLLLDANGLWEAKISGSATERGAVLGMLSQDLLENQERVFVNQIHRLIPSERYVRFLHRLITIFNRNMARYIPAEYLKEIYAMSLSCTHEFDAYGTPYWRQLNYHAAHDIGHTMQEYMLVGCSSFAVWEEKSESGDLFVGRNFDFYVGDAFAENKILLFVDPDSGYRYASVTWPGMVGVVSGMNECGLTVSVNAAKGSIPTSSAMPISLLARHILQYSKTIEEAYALAQQSRTFVSESLLIGSAHDGRAAIIEKTPKETHLYAPYGSQILCTNHFQSDAFAKDKYNMENIATSDSRYRYDRLTELITENEPLNIPKIADILRDRKGLDGQDIGLGNEKSINQFIAHHSVIFRPMQRKMWVSTSPWQCGVYLCFDLNTVFAMDTAARTSVSIPDETIPADSLIIRGDVVQVRAFREQTLQMQEVLNKRDLQQQALVEEYIAGNPEHYLVYDLAGDYALACGNKTLSVAYWKTALTKEIPHISKRKEIEKKIKRHDKK